MFNKKGEIATIITIGALVVLGITTLVSSVLIKKKQTTNSKASEICTDGEWRTECFVNENGEKEQQSCANDAGVEQVFQCVEGQWVYKYPQCAQRCNPDGDQDGGSDSGADSECQGKSPGTVLDYCSRQDCDTNIKEKVCVETYCDSNGHIQEKPGRKTDDSCGVEEANCNKGAVVDHCVRQQCDQKLGKYVCIESYWGDDCSIKEKVGTLTNTSCVKNQPEITGQPTIAWPSIKPTEGEDSIIFSQPTTRPKSTLIPTETPTPTISGFDNGKKCTIEDESCSKDKKTVNKCIDGKIKAINCSEGKVCAIGYDDNLDIDRPDCFKQKNMCKTYLNGKVIEMKVGEQICNGRKIVRECLFFSFDNVSPRIRETKCVDGYNCLEKGNRVAVCALQEDNNSYNCNPSDSQCAKKVLKDNLNSIINNGLTISIKNESGSLITVKKIIAVYRGNNIDKSYSYQIPNNNVGLFKIDMGSSLSIIDPNLLSKFGMVGVLYEKDGQKYSSPTISFGSSLITIE